MAEETKFTLKIGIITSFVSALVIFMLSALWMHQTDITTLRANQQHAIEALKRLDTIPEQLAAINTQLSYIGQTQQVHKKVSLDNNKRLNGSAGR